MRQNAHNVNAQGWIEICKRMSENAPQGAGTLHGDRTKTRGCCVVRDFHLRFALGDEGTRWNDGLIIDLLGDEGQENKPPETGGAVRTIV